MEVENLRRSVTKSFEIMSRQTRQNAVDLQVISHHIRKLIFRDYVVYIPLLGTGIPRNDELKVFTEI